MLTKKGKKLFFGAGLECFVAEFAIKLGEFMLFVDYGDQGFDVKVYGITRCEKEDHTVFVKVEEDEALELRAEDPTESGSSTRIIIASLNYPMLSSGLEMLSREARPSWPNLDLISASRISTEPSSVASVKQNEMSSEAIVLSNHPSKRPRLEGGAITHNLISGNTSVAGFSLTQSSDSSLAAGKQISNAGLSTGKQISNADGFQHTQKQMPQLSAEEETGLLKQLLSLTPEQLSSLPSEQQQQVLEIQRTLRSKPLI